jgi:hypothetical protein
VQLSDAGARDELRVSVAAPIQERDHVAGHIFRAGDELTGWQRPMRDGYIGHGDGNIELVA